MANGPVYLDNGQGGKVLQPNRQANTFSAVATTAATSTTPFGFSEAQANALVANSNAMRLALIEAGIIKA